MQSALGLLLATLTQVRHWQIVLAVATVVGLVVAFAYFSGFVAFVIIQEQMLPLDQAEFWEGVALALSAYVSVFVLVLLAACAQIVAQLGGKITVESDVGLGTTFSVMLPTAENGNKRLMEPAEA